jgi:hypothetical protein
MVELNPDLYAFENPFYSESRIPCVSMLIFVYDKGIDSILFSPSRACRGEQIEQTIFSILA